MLMYVSMKIYSRISVDITTPMSKSKGFIVTGVGDSEEDVSCVILEM